MMSNKKWYINKVTNKFRCEDEENKPLNSDWLEVPSETSKIYYFDGTDPIGEKSVLFYTDDLKATWCENSFDYGGYWSDNVNSDHPSFDEIKKYVTTYGELIWDDGVVKSSSKEVSNSDSKRWYINMVTYALALDYIDLTTISKDWVKVPEGTELIIDLHDIIEFRKGRYHRFVDSNEWQGGQSTSVSQIREGILDCKILHDFGGVNNTVDNGTLKPIKSDGGSSSYYFTKLPQHMIDEIIKTGGIEIKDIVRYCFDNDADCKDIIKALKRIRENLKGGGKEGCDSLYNAKKVLYFAEELLKVVEIDEKNKL